MDDCPQVAYQVVSGSHMQPRGVPVCLVQDGYGSFDIQVLASPVLQGVYRVSMRAGTEVQGHFEAWYSCSD